MAHRLQNGMFSTQMNQLLSVYDSSLLKYFHGKETIIINTTHQKYLSKGTLTD
jgi:hypothetical protein